MRPTTPHFKQLFWTRFQGTTRCSMKNWSYNSHSCKCLQSSALAILLLIDVLPTLEQKRAMTMPLKAVHRMDSDLMLCQSRYESGMRLSPFLQDSRSYQCFILCPVEIQNSRGSMQLVGLSIYSLCFTCHVCIYIYSYIHVCIDVSTKYVCIYVTTYIYV